LRAPQKKFAQNDRRRYRRARQDSRRNPGHLFAFVQNAPDEKENGSRNRQRQNVISRRGQPKRSPVSSVAAFFIDRSETYYSLVVFRSDSQEFSPEIEFRGTLIFYLLGEENCF
jgi:hypothetical protein